MKEMLFLQKEKILKVRVLEQISEGNYERFTLEVLKNLSENVQTETIFEVKRSIDSENDLFGDTKFERFVLV